MESADFVKALEEMGLPEKAAHIYVCLLGHNRMGVAELARRSQVKRATCYEHLELLLKRDMVTRVPIGKRIYYSATDPDKVLSEFKKRTSKFEEQIVEMSRLHDKALNKPKVTFHEGKREIRRIYDDLFKTVGDVQSIFPADAFFESFGEQDYDEFDKTISEHTFKSRDLFVASKHYKKLKEIRTKNGGADKLDKKLPDSFSSNVDVIIYSDKVALISLRDLSAIVIENKDIAELFKNMHAFMWKSL